MIDNLNTDMGIRIKELRKKKDIHAKNSPKKLISQPSFLPILNTEIKVCRYLLYTSFVKPCVY